MSTDDTTTASSDAKRQSTPDVETCAFCETSLERGSQHTSNNRTTILWTCPECKVGALATVEHSGPPSERCQDRLGHAQSNAVTGLSVYRVAAFITDGLPTGEYTVERTDEHEFVIQPPETASQWDVLRLVDRLSIGPLSAEAIAGHVRVEDARWSGSADAMADGGIMQSRIENGETQDPDNDPFAIADDDEPRTERAKTEDMDVSFLEKPGKYEVHSASNSYYEVDVVAEECSCPDERVDRCKHIRRVDIEIRAGLVPRPDGKLPKA